MPVKRVTIEIKGGLMQECVVPKGVEVLIIDFDAGIQELVRAGGIIEERKWIKPPVRVTGIIGRPKGM